MISTTLATINRLRSARDEVSGVINELLTAAQAEADRLSETAPRLWICTDHATHYPVGAASIVIAPSEDQARQLLRAELAKVGLCCERFTLKEVPMRPAVHILCSGDY